MKYFIFIIFALVTSSLAAADCGKCECSDLNDKNLQKNSAEYLKYDFSNFLRDEHIYKKFLGAIGKNYQRIDVLFTEVAKDSKNPLIYHVKGNSTVKNHTQNFEGVIHLSKIDVEKLELKQKLDDGGEMNLPSDSGEYDDYREWRDSNFDGILEGCYVFKENREEKYSGVFSGKMLMRWHVKKNGTLAYDSVKNRSSDSYNNNEYEGTWTAYGSKISKTANWGSATVPNSGDLNIGAADFSANPKYKKYGWEKYPWEGEDE